MTRQADLRCWVMAGTVRRGRFWLDPSKPENDPVQPPSWAPRLLSGLHSQKPSVAWHRVGRDRSAVLAAGFASDQKFVLGEPYWSFVATSADERLTRHLAADLIDAIGGGSAGPHDGGVAAVITRAIVDVDASSFAVDRDLPARLVRRYEDLPPPTARSALDSFDGGGSPVVQSNDDAGRREQAQALRRPGPLAFQTVAATSSAAAESLTSTGSWVLALGGRIEEDPYGLPVRSGPRRDGDRARRGRPTVTSSVEKWVVAVIAVLLAFLGYRRRTAARRPEPDEETGP